MEETSPNKIKIDNDSEESNRIKRLKNDNIDADLKGFLDWCKTNEIIIDFEKVKITKESTSHNYGMIAVKNIKANEVLARIAKISLLEPNNTNINELIKKSELKTDSNWSKLIVSLMHECNNPNSKWSTYLNLFPNYEYLDLPMFWDELLFDDLLENTCVFRNVKSDLAKMKKEFNEIILPFIKKNMQYFNEKCLDFDYYKKIVAFIMAYSFRDPNENPEDETSIGPMMVPVADILNAISKNNAQLCFEENELTLIATKPIKMNEEVFNTYGENSNTDLLHMYGYVEEFLANSFDCVEIPTKCFVDAYRKLATDAEELMNRKVEIFKEVDLIDDNMSFIVGTDGILNEEETLHMLQIYSMKSSEIKEFIENDFELLEDEEWDDFSLTNANLNKMPIDWKIFLNECCDFHMKNLKSTEEKIKTKYLTESQPKNTKRISNTIRLIEGQVDILKNFIKSLNLST